MKLRVALDVILQGLFDLHFFYCIDSKFLVNRDVWSILVMCLPFDAFSYKHKSTPDFASFLFGVDPVINPNGGDVLFMGRHPGFTSVFSSRPSQ